MEVCPTWTLDLQSKVVDAFNAEELANISTKSGSVIEWLELYQWCGYFGV